MRSEKTIVTCNRCGAEAVEPVPNTLPEGWIGLSVFVPGVAATKLAPDLCPKCAKRFEAWMSKGAAA